MNAAVGDGERLVVMLEARVNEFERRMRQAEQRGTKTYQGLSRNSRSATRQMEADMIRSSSAINRAVSSTTGKIGTLAASFAGGLVGGAAASLFAGVAGNIGETVKSMAELGDEAKRAGVSTQAFQEWKFVAEQNRIGVDALVDGLKELNLRADEFVTTGKGSAAEAFTRIGLSADKLKSKLKDPSALMLEIIGRLEGLDKAAQIRVADEIFGGTGGEQFVQLLGQGEGALQDTINRAHEVGAVLDDELIRKAEEVNRKFSEMTTAAGNFAKRVVVEVAAAGVELTDLRDRLDRIFDSEAEGRSILGDETYDALTKNRDLVDENAEALQRLDERYHTLAEEADRAGMSMLSAISQLDSWGYDEAADGLRDAVKEMDELVRAFRDGEITGEEFTAKLADIETAAASAFDQLDAGDRVQFSGVISQLERLGGVIGGIISLAASMKAALASAAGVSSDQKATQGMRDRHAAEAASMESLEAQRTAMEGFTEAEEARNSATAEQLRLQREVEAVRKRAEGTGTTLTDAQATAFAQASLAGEDGRKETRAAGGSGSKSKGGGSSRSSKERLDDYQQEAKGIRERTLALQAEAASIVAASESGQQYGDALEYARTRAELLHAAQQAGKTITPELTAEIDALAQAYVTAGLDAEAAADKMQQIQEQSQRGKDALADMFGSIMDGSMSAKDAVAQLLLEIAKVQMMNGLFSLPGIGGVASGLGGLLTPKIPGFASGGNHSGGLRIVGEKGPELEATGAARYFNADQTQKMLSGGGGQQGVDVNVTVGVDQNGNLQAFVDKQVQTGVTQGIKQYDKGTPQRVISAMNNQRKRY